MEDKEALEMVDVENIDPKLLATIEKKVADLDEMLELAHQAKEEQVIVIDEFTVAINKTVAGELAHRICLVFATLVCDAEWMHNQMVITRHANALGL